MGFPPNPLRKPSTARSGEIGSATALGSMALAEVDLGYTIIGHNLVDRALRKDAPQVQNRYPACDLAHEGHVMFYSEHRHAFGLQGAHQLAGRMRSVGRHSGRWFVEQQQLGLQALVARWGFSRPREAG